MYLSTRVDDDKWTPRSDTAVSSSQGSLSTRTYSATPSLDADVTEEVFSDSENEDVPKKLNVDFDISQGCQTPKEVSDVVKYTGNARNFEASIAQRPIQEEAAVLNQVSETHDESTVDSLVINPELSETAVATIPTFSADWIEAETIKWQEDSNFLTSPPFSWISESEHGSPKYRTVDEDTMDYEQLKHSLRRYAYDPRSVRGHSAFRSSFHQARAAQILLSSPIESEGLYRQKQPRRMSFSVDISQRHTCPHSCLGSCCLML